MKPRLVQIAAGCTPGDAITGEVGILHGHFEYLISKGLIQESVVYAEHIATGNSFRVEHVDRYRPESHDVVLLHYGIAMDTTSRLAEWPGRRYLIFHNITPSSFFRPYNLRVAARLDRGRRDLISMAELVDGAIADSRFNAKELLGYGFRKVHLKPVLFQHRKLRGQKYKTRPNDLREIIPSDQTPVILFVGRIVPNKNHVDIIKILYYIVREVPDARLILAGPFFPGLDSYMEELRSIIRALEMEKSVYFTGFLPEGHLAYLYNRANLFLTTSRHEGFCVPVMEAMEAGIPVLAYWNDGSAIEETMDLAGCGFRVMEHEKIAQLAILLLEDPSLRDKIISGQFERMTRYSRENIVKALEEILLGHGMVRSGVGS